MNRKRELWMTKIGFVFAAAGSAIGLGNLWRFPYIAGTYGGGAFVLVYLLAVIAVGLPIMIAELLIGRGAQLSPVGAFAKLGKNRWWKLVGWLGVVCGFVILSYYCVVGGWIIDYILKSAMDLFHGRSPSEIEDMFGNLLNSPLRQIFYQALFLLLTTCIVSEGISMGIERWNNILIPLLFGIMLLLLINSLFSPGVREGIRFLFYPDFSKITPVAILEATGQAFFSLSLGMGAMITYGSYLDRGTNLTKSAAEVCVMDTVVALMGGMIIFPIIFSYGLAPSAGPGLFFKILPVAFSTLPAGRLIATLFFTLLSFAAITSAISLLEVVVSYFIDERKWKRKKASFVVGFAIFLFGVPSALSSNLLRDVTLLKGMDIFRSLDFLATNYMLTIGGLLISVFCGWFLSRKEIKELTMNGNNPILYRVWRFIIRYITPFAVLSVLLQKTGMIAI